MRGSVKNRTESAPARSVEWWTPPNTFWCSDHSCLTGNVRLKIWSIPVGFPGRGYPPLPGDKRICFSSLRGIAACKFGQTKGLSLNLGKQTVYGLNAMPPAVAEGLFLESNLSIAVGMKLIRQLYFLLFVWVMWFRDLTCDFWAEFEENIFPSGCATNKALEAGR